ncbi:MAG: methyltransferase domain-containing protein [Alphaproteobacteria bacterium]|nr:methyltransferase domain-containing protein [Alphaproteobacteria bacterium]
MTPSARMQTVIDILERLENSRIPMDSTIGDFMRFRKYIGAKDRAWIVETVYGIVRHKARIAYILEKAGAEDAPRNKALVYLAVFRETKNDSLDEFFTGGKYGAPELTDEERALPAKPAPEFPAAVDVECPPEHEERLKKLFGSYFKAEMHEFIEGATLDLRTNCLKSDRAKLKSFLESDKIKTDETPYSPWGLRVQGKAFLSTSKAFVKGFFDIQDEGSQLIAIACDAKPGMQVLDYCAGAGGKTLALAGGMKNKGRIVAMDLEPARLEKARPRFKRASVSDIIEVRPLSDDKQRKWLKRQKETFDVVLADVPCSGSGTWRRNPDMRWRTYGPTLEELTIIQADILDRTAHAVKVGGRLVYATCSLFEEENEKQVHAFLARRPEFKLLPLAEAWPADLQCPCKGDFMRLTPRQHNTDGFFAAVLTKSVATENN